MDTATPVHGAFRQIPYMGVIYVVAEAMKLGFHNGHPDWCNLGQGQPEPGEMEGAPPRFSRLEFEPQDHAYGPIGGTVELRQVVADHYNRLYREGKSRYTADHVSIAAGGRLLLSRAFASLGSVALGYQIPDYTAYEDMIAYHQHRLTAVPLSAREEDGFAIPAATLEREVADRGLEAFVISNPCNPTGNVVAGDELARYVALARDPGCTMLMDEFYSHFIYDEDGNPGAGPVSSAAHVEDVDKEPVIVIDGLTKSFRYPGWRVGWALGPPEMIEILGRAASAIDGGPPQPIQRAALAVLERRRADRETTAVRTMFARKRNLMVSRLEDMGIHCARQPRGTFYAWATIRDLPAPFNDGHAFFRAALEHKVMTVPGTFFDVNPGGRRHGKSPYTQWVRFSFGPPIDNVEMGLSRLENMLRDA